MTVAEKLFTTPRKIVDPVVRICLVGTDEQGQAQSVGEFAPSLALTPVRAMNLTVAYGFFPPDDFPACPPKADLDAYTDDTSGTVDPPAISDECMTSVLVALTGFMG